MNQKIRPLQPSTSFVKAAIVAPEAFSEHPNWAPNYGAWYTSQVLEILTSAQVTPLV